jgi:outer membrane lipoprotein-sorting protein
MKIFSGQRLLFVCCFCAAFFPVSAQEIVTADRYLERVAENYAGVKDYEAAITILSGSTSMDGQISFLSPSFLRIDFTRPRDQVICFNGELLTVYLPEVPAVLNQSVSSGRPTPATGASIASAQGLSLLRRNYVPSFVSGPEPVPLDEGSGEQVVKLRLTRRVLSEGFREIVLSIDPASLLIRRMEGRTIAEALVRFDFSNIRINLGIPEGRFIYDSPASANVYNNFLFRDTE